VYSIACCTTTEPRRFAYEAFEPEAFSRQPSKTEAQRRIDALAAKLRLQDGPPHTLSVAFWPSHRGYFMTRSRSPNIRLQAVLSRQSSAARCPRSKASAFALPREKAAQVAEIGRGAFYTGG
jgi:hypothetical protein